MVTFTMSESSPSKMVHITIPGSGGGYTSSRPESISAKMKKILTSPKGNRGKGDPPPYKTFGVFLDYLFERDNCEVPRIVSRLCEYLKQNGMRQEGLFRVNGNIKVVDRLKTLFDKNGEADLEEIGDVPACASLLKMFLRELADPVVPEDLQPLFINLQHKYCQDKPNLVPRVKELVQRMPQLNRELLKYLSEFMLYISKSSDGNKMTPLALAIVFGPNIFRCGEGLNGLRDQAYVNAVLLLMLQEFNEVFGVKDNEPRGVLEKSPAHLDNAEKGKKTSNQNTILVGENQSKSNKVESTHTPDKTEGTDSKSPSLRKNRTACNVRNSRSPNKSPNISLSPTHSVTSTKQSKQLVENTINLAVKELLFGSGLVTSSCEPDRLDESPEQLKEYPFEMSEETLNEGLVCQTRRTRSCHKKERKNVYDRCMSSPPGNHKNEITDEDLEFVGGVCCETLNQLTSNRVQPPQNRRKPSFRNRSKTKECGNDPTDNSKDFLMNVNKEFVYNNYDRNYDSTMDTKQIGGQVGSSHDYVPKHLLKDRGNDDVVVNKKKQHSNETSTPLQRSPKRKPTTTTQHKPLGIVSPPDVRQLPERCEVDSGSSPQRKHTQDTISLGDMSPPSLKRKIVSLKKIVSNLEANFEETNGRKPKPSEKGQIQKYLLELGRAKKLLKDVLADHCQREELSPQSTPTIHGYSNSSIGPDVLTDHCPREELSPQPTTTIHGYSNASIGPDEAERVALRAKEETLSLLMKKLHDKRLDSGRPEDILGMDSGQLKDEKLAVQKALLVYENQHGRPTSKEDKTLMRPLYDRYRKIKRLITTGKPEPSSKQQYNSEIESNYNPSNDDLRVYRDREGSTNESGRNEINSRISHNNQLHHRHSQSTMYSHDSRMRDNDDDDGCGDVDYGHENRETFNVTNRLRDPSELPDSPLHEPSRTSDDAILHAATVEELLEQQRITKRTKKRLGKLLKDFEEDFFKEYNRKVQKNDRLPKQAEYREYKLIKAKLRLIEALIDKKRGSAQG